MKSTTKQFTKRKLRSPLKTHGGKAYLARRIITHFPDHEKYVEPFCGGLNILLNKKPSPVEIVGDLNPDLIVFWRVVQDRCEEFLRRLAVRTYDETTFLKAQQFVSSSGRIFDDEIKRSLEFLCWNRMSRGGFGKDFAWSERLRGGQPGDKNAWETIQAELPRVAKRLQGVEIKCTPAIELIKEHDGPNTFHYLDPPYYPSTRTAKKTYKQFEMTAADHENLLDAIVGLEGTVIISGYNCQVYNDKLARWRRVTWDIANHSAQGKIKQRRQEIIWINR